MSLASTLALVLTLPLAAQVSVLTYQYDNTRAGANRSELATPVNVNSGTFGKLFSYMVDGLIYGQLLHGERQHPGKARRGGCYDETSVYAFDADTNSPAVVGEFPGRGRHYGALGRRGLLAGRPNSALQHP